MDIKTTNQNNSFWWARLARSYSSSFLKKQIHKESISEFAKKDILEINLIENAYIRAIETNPNENYWIELSDAFFQAKEWEKAIFAIEKAFVLNRPNFKSFADVFNFSIYESASQNNNIPNEWYLRLLELYFKNKGKSIFSIFNKCINFIIYILHF